MQDISRVKSLTVARRGLKTLLLATAIASAGFAVTVPAPVWAFAPIEGYADLVAQVSPAVVYIEVTSNKPVAQVSGDQSPFPKNSPFNDFFKRFGQPGQPGVNPQQRDRQVKGLGSGYIISSSGEIVTNNHVVEGATKVTVKLQDGRTFQAKVIGTDPMTDIALIKIDNAKNLPTVPFGDSAKLRVGDAVMAVGNPYGLGGTVTAGIVSALGRDINSGPYDSYIQTDAAINRGNSGGPLFNTKGQVVGMNTAIFSPSGGSIGIGFSIPANTVERVVAQLRDYGRVSRGWLGVQIQQVTPELASALGLPKAEGALVADVQPNSPALAAGMKNGDVITSVNGKSVAKMHQLPSLIAAIPAGETAKLGVFRDGAMQDINVKIGKLSAKKTKIASIAQPPQNRADPLGVTVESLTPDLAQQLGLGDTVQGVVVTSIDPASPNTDKLKTGDVIEEVAGQAVTTPQDLEAALAKTGKKPVVLLLVNRRGVPLYIGASTVPS